MKVAVMFVALVGIAAAAPKVAVFGFQGIGIDSVTAVVATSVFRTELSATGKFSVASVDEVVTALGSDKVVTRISEAQDAARSMGVAKAVIGSLSKLGTQTIGKVQLIDVSTGVEFEDQLATTSQEELDVVLRRLAKAVASKKKSAADVELGEVTQKEGKEATRREAFFGGIVGFGAFVPIASLGGSNMLMTYAGAALYETPDFFAELRYSASIDMSNESYSGASFMPITIGVFKTASRADFTPYYGGAMGIGVYSYYKNREGYWGDYRSGPGFVISPGAGYMLFHTYDFHVMADARYYLLFGGGEVHHGPALSINLAYRRGKGGGVGCCGLGW